MIVETEFLIRLVLAAILGGLIGLERESHDRPAGLRTHVLVCMGAALFTMTTFDFIGPNTDPSRIAANIVVGIGFIGAGAIFRAENRVKGLTTAADLWVVAGVGLFAGLGSYGHAIIAGVLVWLVLVIGRKLKKKVVKHHTDLDS
ncbi:MgtC/SapB family protein [Candidatus Micrarchaeota archaeon]|nr:MgtC/SapB family protein [Candidatus Micrarchaeota archaeon]MBU1930385.1 MgtC/SapB family protein [Candidatus Micrarchaeota archaeon]